MPAHLRLVEASDDGPSTEEIVAAWWRRSDLLHGESRDPDGAAALDWAARRVSDVLDFGTPYDAVAALDDLLAADGADPAIIACGPLETLLEERGPEVDQLIAEMCRYDGPWRAAVAAVCAPDDAASLLPHTARYLT